MPTQQAEIRNYAIKHGLFIDKEYADPAVSARKLSRKDRPQLDQLLHDIEAGQVGTLLVYKRDRIARKATEYIEIYGILRKYNVAVYFAAENEFPMVYSPIGEFFELFMAGVIEREGDQIAERIQATRLAKFAEGNYATRCPYGYRPDKSNSGKPFVREESELQAVRRVFDLVLSGECEKVSDVFRRLADEGFTRVVNRKQDDGTRASEVSPWDYGHVTGIIQNEIYMGEQVMRFSDEKKSNWYDGLGVVTFDEWWRAQDCLNEMITRRERKNQTPREYLLDRLLWCQVCGAKLVGQERQQHWQKVYLYVCPSHKDIAIACDEVEGIVCGRAREMLDGLMTVHFHQLMKRYVKSNRGKLVELIEHQQARIKEIEKKLEVRVRRLIRHNTDSKIVKTEREIVEFNQELNHEQQELTRLGEMLANLESTVPRVKDMRAHLSEMDNALHTAEVLKELVYRIELGPYGLNIQLRHPFLEVSEVLIREA